MLRELSENYNSMKKGHRNHKNPVDMKNTISEMKNTLEKKINSRLDEVKD